jgi:hypothetical protein
MTSNPLSGESGDEASRRAPGGPGPADAAAVSVVRAFERAVNAGDADQVVGLAVQNVEVGGPRGRGHGRELLREWVERAGIHLRTRRIFQREGVIVAEQDARWGDGDDAEEHTIATEFIVRDGRIEAVIRHDDVDTALSAAGLHAADEVALR